MQALRGLAWLLVLQSVGEMIARGLHLPLPGPVIGMVLLVVALRWEPVREPVALAANFLLSHLSLLFVPVGVGVMTHLSLVSQYGVRMLVVIVVSTLAGLGVTVLSMQLLRETSKPVNQSEKKDGHA
ncbi:MAG: CidA/LrgA family protein [Polaromonas sp.]|uniref:CidA/LrgA family protein n=1 Tax=Polaromonas sp. TaxID=1869339 RepID=UPI0017BA408C|nr:CidA/LrgA family protein [Polaromonas sp.]NMM09613.1 CidA/LrgA family protein [Polaromonas sp.]